MKSAAIPRIIGRLHVPPGCSGTMFTENAITNADSGHDADTDQ